jgi:nucleotide-binding universal stress UspA family protein
MTKMFNRALVAVDHRHRARRSLIHFASQMAQDHGTEVHVIHAIKFAGRGCAAPLESASDASRLVEETVFTLRMSDVGAGGEVVAAHRWPISTLIATASLRNQCDVVLLGTNQARSLHWRFGLREQIIHRSPVPVLVAPLIDEATWIDQIA